jgi:putative FmdB family regulatory protein
MEAFHKISDPPLRDCPACNQDRLERLISGGAFHLKGGGWYKDLYSSSKPQKTDAQQADRIQKAIDGSDKPKAA